ncbi:hypothetical protein ACU6TU_15935 [Halomonas sp. LS-001]
MAEQFLVAGVVVVSRHNVSLLIVSRQNTMAGDNQQRTAEA